MGGPQPTIFTCFTYWSAQKVKPKNPNTKIEKKSQKNSHPSLKSHPNSKKSKKNPKFFFFFWVQFVTKMLIKCSNTSKKSYFHSKKSKKSKRVIKKIYFLFFHILCKKHTVLIIFG